MAICKAAAGWSARILVLTMLWLGLGRAAWGQCYSFSSPGENLTIQITNLPPPKITVLGSGTNTTTVYDYDLTALPGNRVTMISGSAVSSSERFSKFTINVDYWRGGLAAVVFHVDSADRPHFLAVVTLSHPAYQPPAGALPSGLTAELPPPADWSGKDSAARLLLLSSTSFDGRIDTIERCGLTPPASPVCSLTLDNRAGDIVQAQVSIAPDGQSAGARAWRFTTSTGELDASVAPGATGTLLPLFVATADNLTIRGAQTLGAPTAARCTIRSTILPPSGDKTLADDIRRITVSLQGFSRYGSDLPLYASVPYKEAMAALHSALHRLDVHRAEDRLAFMQLAHEMAHDRNRSYPLLMATLDRFAEMEVPLDDELADEYLVLFGQAVGESSSHPIITPDGLPAVLVAAGDIARSGEDYRLAAYLYKKALSLGDVRMLNFLVTDPTPTAAKLASCLLEMGKTAEANALLARPAAAAAQRLLAARAVRGQSQVMETLERARGQLQSGNSRAALQALDGVWQEFAAWTHPADDSWYLVLKTHALALLAMAHAGAGDMSGALAQAQDFAANYEHALDQTLMELTEGMARVPYVKMLADTDLMLELLTERQQLDFRAAPTALQILISRTARLPEMAGDRARLYRAAGADRVFKLRAERATLVLRGRSESYRTLVRQAAALPANLSAPPGTELVQEAIGQLQYAEDALTTTATGKESFSTHPVTVADVALHLDPEATVFFYAYIPHPGGSPQWRHDYILCTLNAKSEVWLRFLGSAEEIDGLIRDYLGVLGDVKNRASNTARLNKLSQTLFSEVFWNDTTHAAPKKLIVIPDGLIATLPFGALLDPDGQPLIARAEVTYASGLRELVRGATAQASRNPAALIGYSPDVRGTEGAEAFYLTHPLQPLEHVEGELQAIARSLAGKAQVYSGSAATEALIKSLTSPSVLHIAAHGRYMQDGDDAFLDAFEMAADQPNGLTAGGRRVANPLLHSYLALAEYDHIQPLDREDGILTPLEILGLNLSGTDLAVASACSTGAGPIERGDGVYSLRTAFALAGAKTQVVSLWDVGDAATRSFMTRYYDLLAHGMRKIDALTQTQRDFLTKDPQFSDPAYWAAFTASGDNGALALTAR
jgi:CHAT domain-containing protein